MVKIFTRKYRLEYLSLFLSAINQILLSTDGEVMYSRLFSLVILNEPIAVPESEEPRISVSIFVVKSRDETPCRYVE